MKIPLIWHKHLIETNLKSALPHELSAKMPRVNILTYCRGTFIYMHPSTHPLAHKHRLRHIASFLRQHTPHKNGHNLHKNKAAQAIFSTTFDSALDTKRSKTVKSAQKRFTGALNAIYEFYNQISSKTHAQSLAAEGWYR